MGTIFALLILLVTSGFSYLQKGFFGIPWEFNLSHWFIGITFVAIGVVELIILVTGSLSLQKSEQNLTPGILDLFNANRKVIWIHRGILFIVLFLVALIFYRDPLPVSPIFIILPALGLAFDLLHALVGQIYDYLNPFKIIKLFIRDAEKAIANSREMDLCKSLESLSELGMKGLDRSSPSLCNEALDGMREVIRLFLESSKSIAFNDEDKQAKEGGVTDKVSYTLFYFFDRVEVIFQKALAMGYSHVCGLIIVLLGKIVLYAAQTDLSLASYGIHFLGKFSKKAQEELDEEVAVKGVCTLLEVSKAIIQNIPLTYMDLKDPFFSVVAQLDAIEKEAFKQNKDIPIKFLIAPIYDLKKQFESPKVAEHPDTPAVIQEIDRILAEWEALDSVLHSFPPIVTENNLETPQP